VPSSSASTDARERFGMRIIEFSVLGNHLHVLVEAESSVALSRGMQGLNVRIAKALNGVMQRRGSVFDDHYHSRLLPTPTQLVKAIGYILGNHEHHYGRSRGVDPFLARVRQPARTRDADDLAAPRRLAASPPYVAVDGQVDGCAPTNGRPCVLGGGLRRRATPGRPEPWSALTPLRAGALDASAMQRC
jgi:REP element-mobilizing transposase RayT